MKYPENWNNIMENDWINGSELSDEENIIVTKDEDGNMSAHKVKGIDWIETARANWTKIAASVVGICIIVGTISLVCRLLFSKKNK